MLFSLLLQAPLRSSTYSATRLGGVKQIESFLTLSQQVLLPFSYLIYISLSAATFGTNQSPLRLGLSEKYQRAPLDSPCRYRLTYGTTQRTLNIKKTAAALRSELETAASPYNTPRSRGSWPVSFVIRPTGEKFDLIPMGN